MSPEQVAGKKVDHRTDIFALGSVFYELVTREKPFRGDVATILYKIVNEDPPAPSIINPALPGGIDAIIRKALAKNPNDRFQCCEEMRSAFLEQAGISNVPAQPSVPAVAAAQQLENRSVEAILAELTEETPQTRRIWPGIAAAVVMMVAAGVAFAFYASATFTHFPAVIRNIVARAKHDVPALVSTAVKSQGSLAEQGHAASGDESSPDTQAQNGDHPVTDPNTETTASSKPAPVPAETPAASSSASVQPVATNNQPINESSHSSMAESQAPENPQDVGEPDRTKSAQTAPPQQAGKTQLASENVGESSAADPNAAKVAATSATEQTPPLTATSLTKPHPKPRREPSSVDGFTRRDIPELLREAAAAAGRGDYRLAIYSYNLILKLDPANSTAKAALHRVQAAQQPQ
jgi:serine/threonine protein kinase